MILSALLTSVGINLGLCILFFTLYSILRKQPSNVKVYAPRLFAERKTQPQTHFNLERLVPSSDWVRRAWKPSEDEILSALGMDAVVFLRIFVFSLRVFTFGGIIGIFILLPVNYLGNQLEIDIYDLPNKSLESFSISNVNNGSNRLWIHFCAAYVFTGFVCYLLYMEYRHISSIRMAHYFSSKPQPHQFTLLVRSIPVLSGKSISDSVDDFFTENYSSTYLSNLVVRRTHKLHGLISEAEKVHKSVVQLKLDYPNQPKFKRNGCLGICGPRVNQLDHYEKKLEELEDNVKMEQSLLLREEVPAAFVFFKSQFGAGTALHMQQGINPTEWVTEQAPEPHDVHWPFFSSSFIKRWICKLVVFLACAVLIILFLIPVALVQALTHLDQLETWFPFLKSILTIAVVSQVITGYLPSLILQTFLSWVPPVMIFFSSIEGYVSWSKIEKSACGKMLWFTIWNIFFANVLSGTALYQVNIFLEPKNIPRVLAEAVPGQASFFIAYVVTSGWTSLSSEIFQLYPLVFCYFRRVFCGKTSKEFEVPSFSYHSVIPKFLFFGLLGMTFFFLAPLILPFLLVFYGVGYIVYRNQLLNVYTTKYETGGKFWPIVHNSTIFSLLLMNTIAIGIFGLKKKPLASALIIPLQVFIFLFNEYCRKRFLPTFQRYSAECLVKKDKEDQNDPTITEFLDNLVTTYKNPALMPIKYSENLDRQNSPLLSTDEV